MTTLTSAPFTLILVDLVEVRILATNSVGNGLVSNPNTSGALVKTVPSTMPTPTLVALTSSSVLVSWPSLTGSSTGNSAITTYNLYWDNGSGTSSISLSNSLTTSYTVTGLTGGTTYLFKLRAQNIYGYGTFSADGSVVAAEEPGMMSQVTTTISGTDLKISWTQPDDGDDTIDFY